VAVSLTRSLTECNSGTIQKIARLELILRLSPKI